MNADRKRLLILQNYIPHYRKPVYEGLAATYDVTILHSGAPATSPTDGYRELIQPAKKLGPFLFQRSALREIRNGYDCVVAMFDIRWFYNVWATLSRSTPRYLLWGHRYGASKLANSARDFLMRRADGLIQYSDCEVERMVAGGVPREKIFVAPNTIHIANHGDGSSCDKDSFLFVGRAQKRKRVHELLIAFSDVQTDLPVGTAINIVGQGVENTRLKLLANELGIADRVNFLGSITDAEQLKRLFGRAYAYVSPGPVGLGVLHSLAYGVPVVTDPDGHHGPEFNHLSDGGNSILFSGTEQLGGILLRLVEDTELCRTLGQNAYARYESHGLMRHMLDGFIQAIESDPQPLSAFPYGINAPKSE